jgi:ATP-dependent Clp protease ATP-binding subunit ClpB
MRLDKLTTKSQEALADADIFARRQNHQEINSLHMLAALIAQEDGTVRPVLERAGISPEVIDRAVEEALQSRPVVEGAEPGTRRMPSSGHVSAAP